MYFSSKGAPQHLLIVNSHAPTATNVRTSPRSIGQSTSADVRRGSVYIHEGKPEKLPRESFAVKLHTQMSETNVAMTENTCTAFTSSWPGGMIHQITAQNGISPNAKSSVQRFFAQISQAMACAGERIFSPQFGRRLLKSSVVIFTVSRAFSRCSFCAFLSCSSWVGDRNNVARSAMRAFTC